MKNRVKVLLVMPEIYHGGAEKQFRSIISYIDKEKYDLTVAIEHSYAIRDLQLEEGFIKENQGVRFIPLSHLSSIGNVFVRYASAVLINIELAPLLLSFRPDIVITYTLLGLKVTILSKLIGAKCIFSERNSGVYPEKFYRKQRMFLKSTEIFVANSQGAQRRFNEHLLNTQYIPNGIEKERLIPEQELAAFTIAVPARIARIKNQEFLIKAISSIKENIRVIFIGKVEDEDYKTELLKLAVALRVEKKISFAGYSRNIGEIYKNASLIILPSVSEGFSNVILESYMYGRICLASDIEMNRDIGAPGQRYFNLDDVGELRNQIIEIFQLPKDVRQREIMQNYEYVTRNYSMENMTMKYEEIFQRIVGGGTTQ